MKFKNVQADQFFGSKYNRIFSPKGIETFIKHKKIFNKNKKFMTARETSLIKSGDEAYKRGFLPENENYSPFYCKLTKDQEDEALSRIYRYSPAGVLTSRFPINSFLNLRKNLYQDFDFILNLFTGIVFEILPFVVSFSEHPKAINKMAKITTFKVEKNIPRLSNEEIDKLVKKLWGVEKLLYCWDGEEQIASPGSPFHIIFSDARMILDHLRQFESNITAEVDREDLSTRLMSLDELNESKTRGARQHLHWATEWFVGLLWILELCMLAKGEDPSAVSIMVNKLVIEAALKAYEIKHIYAHPDLEDLIERVGISYDIDHTDAPSSAAAISDRVNNLTDEVVVLTGVPRVGSCGHIVSRAIYRNTHTEDILELVDACIQDCVKIADAYQ